MQPFILARKKSNTHSQHCEESVGISLSQRRAGCCFIQCYRSSSFAWVICPPSQSAEHTFGT